MKDRREISGNSKCIGQQTASGSALRIFLLLFKKYQRKTLSYLKRILCTHPFISKKLVSFGQYERELITGRLQLKMVKTLFGFGLVLIRNTKEYLNKWANKSLHLTAIPLRSIAAGELERYAAQKDILIIGKHAMLK